MGTTHERMMDMNDLEQARAKISQIDKEMAALFEQRMNAAETIGLYKKEKALAIKDAEREAQLIDQNVKLIASDAVRPYYIRFLENMFSLSSDYQRGIIGGMKIAFSGTRGAFADAAAGRMFPGAENVAYANFEEAYRAVENGDCDAAVLPIENSYEGEVGAVLDLLFTGHLYINRVFSLPVRHCLLAKKGAKLDGIKTVVSHPQALAQCAAYIGSHGFAARSSTNTALAAKEVSEGEDLTVAAVGSAENAALFGLEILENGINDSANNATRFAALSRVQNLTGFKKQDERDTFILVFTVRNQAGSLAQMLNILGSHGYNMRSLHSRPMKNLQWNYYFYIEAEGNVNNQNGRDMLQEMNAVCAQLKLAGTFREEKE